MLPVRRPRGIDGFSIYAVKGDRRRLDQRLMRSGEAEDAMRAAGVIRIASRQVRRILAVMETKFERRRAVTGVGGEGESANGDQQALSGDRISGEQAHDRSPEATTPHIEPEYATAHDRNPSIRAIAPKAGLGDATSSRPHAHKRLAPALGDQLVVLVVGAVMKLDDAGSGPRF